MNVEDTILWRSVGSTVHRVPSGDHAWVEQNIGHIYGNTANTAAGQMRDADRRAEAILQRGQTGAVRKVCPVFVDTADISRGLCWCAM